MGLDVSRVMSECVRIPIILWMSGRVSPWQANRNGGNVMKRLIVLSAVGLLLVATAAAQAGGSREGDECVKWSQLPEMLNPWGFDVESNFDPDGFPNQVVMDDWLCETGLPVTDVHWWGSYFDPASPIEVEAFHISIHADIPAEDLPSHPGPILAAWEIPFAECNKEFYGVDYYGNDVYQYFCYLPEWFFQEEGTIYWLDIIALVSGAEDPVWGWHTAVLPHNIDDAVVIGDYDMASGNYTQWYPLEWESGESLDMAFELTTIPEPLALIMIGSALAGLAAIARRKM